MKRLAFVGGVLVVALFAAVVARASIDEPDPVVIVHWANSHPMREGLLPDMAEDFNKEDHETADGRPIKIVVISCDSSDQAADLVGRVGGDASEAECLDDSDEPADNPTIITPQSDDWLVDVINAAPGHVIDLGALSIAETWLGIVTYRDMAECLGWPDKEVGYAEVIEVLEEGWAAHPECSPDSDWGDPPNLVFTNPNTSTSGRNVLVSLFTMFANKKSPSELTPEDIQDPALLAEVRSFQELVEHYMPATFLVNTKIAQGPLYGSFFLMPEDNLANLMLGNEDAIGPDGTRQAADAPEDLVMIYPKEGAVLNSNPAAVVDAPWVSDEETEAAERWIEYLLEDDQQRAFMDLGFRPAEGSDLKVNADEFGAWGLDPATPQSTIDPGKLRSDVLAEILDQWGSVKKPAIVTFVVDLSGSMDEPSGATDERLIDQVKTGLIELLNAMAGPDSASPDSQVGLVTFTQDEQGGPAVEVLSDLGPLTQVPAMGEKISQMEAGGQTALYDAVKKAIEITHAAEGEAGATRAVVVLSDGEDNLGETCLDDLVTMARGSEAPITRYCGKLDPGTMQPTDDPQDAGGAVPIEDVKGTGSKLAEDVQVFFLGFGPVSDDEDAVQRHISIGRILAEATDGEYRRSDEDLATVIQALSGYF